MAAKSFSFLVPLCMSHAIFAASKYHIQGIPLPSGATSPFYPVVSQSHDVAFTSYTGQFDGATLQFVGTPNLWHDGQLTTLPLTGGATSGQVFGINSSGLVVGSVSDTSGNYHPVVWANGIMTYLPQGGMQQGGAYSINDSNEISGSLFESSANDMQQAAFWTNGTLANLGSFNSTYAAGGPINNNSQIVISTSSGYLLYQEGQAKPITGLLSPTIYALGNNGEVAAGASRQASVSSLGGGPAMFLPNLSDPIDVYPLAINDEGAIVGITELTTESAATLWQDGNVYDLNSLIDPNSGWVLGSATGITDDGTIVGVGAYQGQQEVFMLTPIASTPEPTTFATLGLALACLACRRRR